jgi:hypothetical protein
MVLLCIAGTVHAETAPPPLTAVRAGLAQPHALRDAAARQRVAPQTSGQRSGRASSKATKATAVAAMGFVGFWVGAFVSSMTAYALRANDGNGGKTIFLTGGVAGAVGGGFLGGWLASR